MVGLNIVFNYIAIQWYGLIGVAFVSLFLAVLQFIFFFQYIVFKEKIKFKYILLIKPFLAAVPVYLAASWLPHASTWATFIFYGLICIGFYFVILFLIRGINSQDFEILWHIIDSFREKFR